MTDYSEGNKDNFYGKMTCAKSYFFDAMDKCNETNPNFILAETFYANFA